MGGAVARIVRPSRPTPAPAPAPAPVVAPTAPEVSQATAIKKGYKRKKFVSTNNNYKSLLGS